MTKTHLIAAGCLGVLLLSSVAVSAATTVIVDDLDSGFSRYGPVSNWHEAAIGYGSHIYWTWNAYTTTENYARWWPNLPGAGTYAVSVYVPNDHAYTTAATYKVFHNGVTDTRVVNQNNFSNVWVGLGDFYFSAGGGEYVELADKTGEAYATKQIGFDAVSFTPVSGTRLLGLDVSSYQGFIDWTQVHNAGKSFAFVRASWGTGNTDSQFENNAQNATSANVLWGAYHFAYPTLTASPEAEAQWFVNVAGSYITAGNLLPVLDIENDSASGSFPGQDLGKTGLSLWVNRWIAEVKRLKGVDAIIYCNQDYAANYLDATVTGHTLWIANPTGNPNGTPSTTGPWPTWIFQQYDWHGACPGVSGEALLDVFHGDIAALNSYVIGGGQTDENPPVVNSFSVSPLSVTLGNSFTINYTVTDTGGSGLNRVELWRANDSGGSPINWAEILPERTSLSGNGPVSGSFSDAPSSAGTYWYGMHVVDNAGNWNDEKNSNTGGLPGVYGPIMVTVNLPPTISVTPASRDFGSVQVGSYSDLTFTVQNAGGGTLTGSASAPSPFTIFSGGSYSLTAGQSQVVTVRFSPTAAQSYSQNVSFTGGGGATRPISGSGYLAPTISVTPASRDFGSVQVGYYSDLTFTVQNAGGGTLSGSASTSAPFSIFSGGTYNLSAGQSQTVTVRFSPTAVQSYSENVTFTSGGGATRPVSGTGYIPPAISVTPSSRDFGSVQVGSYADLTFTVQNTGGGTLTGGASVPSPFSIVSGGSYSLGAGQSQVVTVRFSPTAAQSYSQNVSFTGGGGATIPVSGTGYSPPVSYTLTVNSSGASSVSIGSSTGHDGITPYNKTVLAGTSVNLQTPQYVGSGASRMSFTGWTGDVPSSSQTISFSMNGTKTVTANYVSDPEPVLSPMTVDLNNDGIPNFYDFSFFAMFWLDTSCSSPSWCEGRDFNHDGAVGIDDLQIFTEFWLWPVADLDMDGAVNFTDYAIFANNWMDDTCCDPNWCEGTDFDHSGSVDMLDLATFARYWLEGI